MKRTVTILLALVICLLSVISAAEGSAILSVGDKGKTVIELHRRLKELRYIQVRKISNLFSEKTEEAIRSFQQLNGMPETGILDQATWDAIFSDTAVYHPYPTLEPLATPGPTPVPDWPERDAEGYLAGEGEYVYENDGEGLWIYLSKSLQVIITSHTDSSVPLVWFETEILTRNGESFYTVQTDPERPGRKYQYPYVIAKEAGCVLAFSDDFFAARMAAFDTVGIIIRDGQVISSKTHKMSTTHLPNLDMLALFKDGSMAAYECNEHTAEELLEMGAAEVFSFGPVLLKNGEINEKLYRYYRSTEPRQALGMIAPGHYLLLSVQGRIKESKGTMLQRVAEMMKARGVTEALNLDGGNTMALVFRGRMLNKLATWKRKKFVRTVTSVIGIGHTDNQSEE